MRYILLFPFLFALSIAGAQTNSPPLTGTHFAQVSDFPALGKLGYDFALITLNPSQPSSWKAPLDAAQAAGIRLLVGAYPLPYVYSSGSWSISNAGQQLFNYLQSRSDQVFAIFVFNEPYYTNPYDGTTAPCGYFSAADLRALRSAIQGVWAGAKIYQDIGMPSAWTPGSSYTSQNPCVGNKYADQTNVADYVGIWYYPFTRSGYLRAAGISTLTSEANFILNSMQPAQPVALNQAFACPQDCGDNYVFPTASQILDWNCTMRSIPFAAVDWYPWRKFSGYTEGMSDAPGVWPLTTAAACNPGMGSDTVGLSSASRQPFVAADSFVTLNGANLAALQTTASIEPLPPLLGGVTLQITDSGSNQFRGPLSYVSPSQINFVMPSGVATGQVAISVSNGLGSTFLGTAIVENVAPGLFSADGSGGGVAAAVALTVNGDQQTVTPAYQCSGSNCTAQPIDVSAGSVYLIFAATGVRHYTSRVAVSINGVSVPVAYAGPQGSYDGLDQINAGPLTGFQGAGAVNVFLSVDGQASNTLQVTFK